MAHINFAVTKSQGKQSDCMDWLNSLDSGTQIKSATLKKEIDLDHKSQKD